MADIRDDSAGNYGTWSSPQDQSWLDWLKMKGSDIGGGAMNALSNLSGAVSQIGTSPEGNMAFPELKPDTYLGHSQPKQSAIFDPFDIGGGQVSIDESNNRQRAYRDQQRQYKKAHPAEMRSRPDAVWPSPLWWEDHGITSPHILDRYGQTQSAILGAINGLGLGIPEAITKLVSPEASNAISGITSAHPSASKVGELAGFVGGPANKVFRAAGDKLLARGFGTKTAAAADATSAAVIQTAPSLIDGDGVSPQTAAASGVAGMSRYLAPYVPKSIVARGGVGALAGTISGLPSMAMEGFPHGLDQMLWGGIYGAAMRGKKNTHEPKWNEYTGNALSAAGTLSAIGAAPTLASIGARTYDEIYNSPTKTFGWEDLPRPTVSVWDNFPETPDWLDY